MRCVLSGSDSFTFEVNTSPSFTMFPHKSTNKTESQKRTLHERLELLNLLNLQYDTREHESNKIKHFLVDLHKLSAGLIPSKLDHAISRISLLRIFLRFGKIE